MGKEGQADKEQLLAEQLKHAENMKSSICQDATGALMSFASVIPDEKYAVVKETQLYDEINGQESVDDDMEPLMDRALENISWQHSNSYDVMGSGISLNVIKDRDAFNEYKGKLNKMADKLDELLDNNVADGKYGEKSKEFLRSISSNHMRRIASGETDKYLSYKNILAGGMISLYATLDASTLDDRLQKNIEKWEHKFPVHQLVADGEKQMKTMSDYWMEKEKHGGALSPEWEQEYRQKLYDQTVNMSALYDKMVSSCESKQVNDELKADNVLQNPAFHLHPMSNRGTSPLKSGLHAMKIGLENGWDIEDIGRLAAFYNVVYKEQTKAICNGALEIDKFEKYDEPRYQSKEHEEYVHRLETAWKNVEGKKLESADDRKKILEDLDELIKEGIKNKKLKSADDSKEIPEKHNVLVEDGSYLSNNKGAVHYYNQTMRQGVIRDHMIETGKEPAFYDQAHNIKMGQERRFDTILADMNASRLGRESDEHKNMRTAMEELQTFLKENPKKDVTTEKLADYSAKYLEKLEAVKKTTDVYKAARRGASTEAGKTRLRGAEEASMLAGIEIDNVMQELKANGLANEKDSVEVYRIKASADRLGYNGAVKEQAKNIDELVNNLKGVDGWTSSDNFKNLKNGLNELKKYSDKLKDSSKDMQPEDMKKYNELIGNVSKLADTYLDNKKDINSDYARRRVETVKLIKNSMKTLGEAFKDAPAKIAEEKALNYDSEFDMSIKDASDYTEGPSKPVEPEKKQQKKQTKKQGQTAQKINDKKQKNTFQSQLDKDLKKLQGLSTLEFHGQSSEYAGMNEWEYQLAKVLAERVVEIGVKKGQMTEKQALNNVYSNVNKIINRPGFKEMVKNTEGHVDRQTELANKKPGEMLASMFEIEKKMKMQEAGKQAGKRNPAKQLQTEKKLQGPQ